MSQDRKSLLDFASPHLRNLHGYTPGFQPKEDGWIKLNTNESAYPPSPKVSEAIRQAADDRLRLYPEPASMPLREAIGDLHSVGADRVFVGNGSDEILALLTRAFSGIGMDVSYPVPSYSLYPVLCGIQNADAFEIPFTREMELPIEAAANSGARILFLTSPNAPTGVGFSNESIAALLDAFDGVVVVDEAYADFADENAVPLLSRFENLVVTRTLSKSYALAGLRVGYALGSPDLVGILDRIRDSYNVNRLSQAGALAAIADQDYLSAIVSKIRRTRDASAQEFANFGWFTYRSEANYLFTEPLDSDGNAGPEVAQSLFEQFKSDRILVRYFGAHALTDSFLRISVGDDDQMLSVSESIQKWQKNA